MKKLTTLLAVAILTATIWAQSPQKMSYQAVIRDASNTLVTNTAVGMQLSILQGTATGTAVYVETQKPTTNANGLASLEIGDGTIVSGDFTTIDWSAGPYFIKTETDPAGGTTYTITGTSQLLSVPYALHATTADTATNVTGLEKITENGKTGWRLIGRDSANYGDISYNAIDLSTSFNPSATFGATGNTSIAMGHNITASGDYSMAMGRVTKANAYVSVALGTYNVGGGNAATWVATDPLFEIGNGVFGTPSNALTVYKNGIITAPSMDIAEITDNKALITKEYADANLISSGLEQIKEYSQVGWRLIGRNAADFGNIGVGAIDFSRSNSISTTLGATGYYSFAIGSNTTASGDNSMSMGFGTKAQAYACLAMGEYNIGGGNAAVWSATDPLFEIGNGTSSTPSNALTVLKNGNTDVSGVFRATGNVWPSKGAGVEIAYDATLGRGYVQAYDRSTANWKDLFLGGLNVAPINDNYTSLGTSTNRWLKVYAVNGSIQTSDRRLKKDINDIPYGLNSILKLRPVTFKWKEGNQNVNLGLIAQDVQKVIPEVVDVGDDKDKTLGLNYTELIPVLVSAIKEQQKEIEELKKKVEQLASKN